MKTINTGNSKGIFFSFLHNLFASWFYSFKEVKFTYNFIGTISGFVAMNLLMNRYIIYIENRKGIYFCDIILNYLPAWDVSKYIFLITYFSILLAIIYLFHNPKQCLTCLQAYFILIILRTACIFLVPLGPPPDIIVLVDPIVNNFVFDNYTTNRDLFFSGHASTLFLLSLVVLNRALKFIFLIATLIVAVLVLIQRVHYTIDVLAAPIFAYISYFIVSFYNKKLQTNA
jgi:hypothetical protein